MTTRKASALPRLDRRALVASGAAAALLAATGMASAGVPRRGGRLRVALERPEGDTLPAARAAVFDTLMEIGADGLLTGELATGWDSDADAMTWQIRLRPGVTFHDGTRLGAEDVAASLRNAPFWADATDIAAVARDRVRVTLAQPDPNLPFRLADPALIVTPHGIATDDPSTWNGTGLYQMISARPGRHFLGRRLERHYKDGRAGWADAVEFVVVPDARVRAEALAGDHVDVAERPAVDALPASDSLARLPAGMAGQVAARRGVGIPAHVGTRAPLDDLRIAERWWLA
ncbi:ABC transporter substrate-binding protein [Chachezhania sediminis]|uniref:ABC transporter substrate-binding protein n=1 Tax=Chachezhania sediminis TaxID=2599291 RepID=UPI001E385189|nr:ABC transporter substrate-binding protein [Chachezhania sediminis]